MKIFGMRMPFLIAEQGQIWRLVASLYINQGFMQLIINCLLQLFVGMMLEAALGSLRMCAFWFTAGISANLFAAMTDDMYATGAEPAVFAMISSLLAMYIYYWDNIECESWCAKICGCFMFIMILVIVIFLMTTIAAPFKNNMRVLKISYPDSMGILGGFLFGMPLAWVLLPYADGSYSNAKGAEKCLFFFGLIWTLCLNAISIAYFFSSAEP